MNFLKVGFVQSYLRIALSRRVKYIIVNGTCFCSDTIYNESIIPIIENVDVLYHEATFLDSEESLAEKTMHCTAKQAARIALKANVKQLVLGHYSTRYESIELFKDEATTISPEVLLADDGRSFEF